MNLKEYIRSQRLILDGGMGTMLQKAGLVGGEMPERLSLTRPELIRDIHSAYLRAGSNVILTNTFGANALKLDDEELRQVVFASVSLAREAVNGIRDGKSRFVALDIGPLGRMLSPFGDMPLCDAISVFKKTVSIGVKAGVDLVFIETMNDLTEARAALIAAKECTDLPIFVSMAYGEDGRLMTGATPEAVIATLEGLGADAIGVNCSLGPKALTPIVEKYIEFSSVPVIVKPNAGLPRLIDGRTVYDVSPSEFASELAMLCEKGAAFVGGCCGTTPEHILALSESVRNISYSYPTAKEYTVVSSMTEAVVFGDYPTVIGERLNPTGKKLLKEALLRSDVDHLLKIGITEEEEGADILDVNVGLPGINECDMLTRVVTSLMPLVKAPLSIDTSNAEAMESALRAYTGKALINSVSGKEDSMRSIFPLVKKYGGVLIALTLDENGIPGSAEGRVAIAEKILRVAREYGIGKKDIIFDPLALSVSADPTAAITTLTTVRVLTEKLGVHTVLGVSNSSYGLPMRESATAAYLSAAILSGLSAAILNPHSSAVMTALRSAAAMAGRDQGFSEFIRFSESYEGEKNDLPHTRVAKNENTAPETLIDAIRHGLSELSGNITEKLLLSTEPMAVIEGHIIPALDSVGRDYEAKKIYLPTLLLSAEAASAAFNVIRSHATDKDKKEAKNLRIILATVEGDVHDIGKNIVKLMLENYGFSVTDLGKDVPVSRVVEEAIATDAHIVGLSALMTTTTPAMERTIASLREHKPDARIIVGGAVLSEEYARSIGADAYAPDAMGAVRYCESVEAELR